MPLNYGDKIIYMEGIIVRVTDGAVGIDLKGRLGYLEIPMRMLITDYPIKIGQEVGFNMSFIEQLSEEPNETYVNNQINKKRSAEEIKSAGKGERNA
ncbi:MAG: CBO2463/CBO2479 domain-containing protein [Lachnospiraceae bacterium]